MLAYDFVLAWRGLSRHPRTSLLAILTTALGLAATMTTLTLLHVLTADPLPGLSRQLYLARVDTVQAKPADYGSDKTEWPSQYRRIKMADAQALLAAHRAARQVALDDMQADVESDGGRRMPGQTVLATGSEFLPMFGLPLRYGRGWSTAEDAARAPVAVIDADLAQQLFGTANAVGRGLRIKNTLFRIVGVSDGFAPQPHFYDLSSWSFGVGQRESVFAPYTAMLDAGLTPSGADACDDQAGKTRLVYGADAAHCAWLSYWVELDTPRQVADYRAYLARYAAQQKTLAGRPASARLFAVDEWLTLQAVVPDNVRLDVWLAGSFLLLCMVNVAGLLASRFLRRGGEIGVRRALGAPRRSVFLQHVLEAGLVSLFGGLLALPLTLFGLWTLRLQDQGFTDLARLDPSMFGALFALALVVGMVTGLLPAWRAASVEPGLQVKSA